MEDLRSTILPAVAVLIAIFVGITAANIAGGIGEYTTKLLNNSLGGGITINLFDDTVINITRTGFIFLAIGVIIAIIAIVIRMLMNAATSVGGAPSA